MSVNGGPYIVTNGLLLDFDMNNTARSWKGKPTTNTYSSLVVFNGLTGSYVGMDNDGWSIYSLSGTWNSGTYPYSMAITSSTNFFGNTSYSAQMQIKTSCPQKFAGWGAINYVNDPNMVSGGTQTITDMGSYQIWKRENFIYSVGYAGGSGTSQYGYLVTQPVSNGTVFNASTDFVYIKNVQIEQNSFCTPFTPFSRSTTTANLDGTGKSTITSNNLVYNSDNTYQFIYSNPSTLQVPLATAFNKLTGTINVWIYPTSYNGGNGIFVNRSDSTYNAVDWLWIGPYSNTFYFRLGDGSTCCSNDLTIGSYSSVVPTNTWTNLCCTWSSGGTSCIYINGSLYTSRSISSIPSTSPDTTGTFGCGHANADSYFNGKMPSGQIYNRQLSADEVLQNFTATRKVYGI